jgi:hypothetical protein
MLSIKWILLLWFTYVCSILLSKIDMLLGPLFTFELFKDMIPKCPNCQNVV